MLLTTANNSKRLLNISFIGHVTLDDLKRHREDLADLLAELSPGFRLLVDLSYVESIQADCAPEIGEVMEQIDRCGVETVVRVIPDPTKDIGLRILTAFHYRSHPRVIACENMVDAMNALEL